jgi:hypothetical protein
MSVSGEKGRSITLSVTDEHLREVKRITGKESHDSPTDLIVDGLEPGTRYDYRLTQGQNSVTGNFVTARTKGQDFTFAVQADSHLDGNSSLEVYRRTLGNIVADKPDFMVDLGDTFMVDKYGDYTQAAEQYRAQKYWFSRVGQQASVFLCLGNHDGEVGWPNRARQDIAGWARTQREGVVPAIPKSDFYSGLPGKGLYYAWNWGDATFIVLDPFVATSKKPRVDSDGWNWTLGDIQYRWLTQTLEQSDKQFKFVFIHHLVGGLGKDARGGAEAAGAFEWGDEAGYKDNRPGWPLTIHRLLVKHKVTAVFHGHDHLYARQEKDGIFYMETPQPSFGRHNSPSSVEEYGYRSGIILGSPGYLRVSVQPSSCQIEYVQQDLQTSKFKIADSVGTS